MSNVKDKVEVEKVKGQVEADKDKDKVRGKSSGEKKVDTKKGKSVSVTVNVDNSFEDILELDNKGFLINFDTEKFVKLGDDEVEQLRHETKRNYFIALGQLKEKESTGRNAKKMYADDLKKFTTSPFQGMARQMLEPPRERRGWHFCWKAPEEVESAKIVGYRVVREPTKEQKKEGFEPGYEKGEVVKIGAGEHAELIAMECPQHLYDQHQAAVSYQSSGRFEQKAEEWRDLVLSKGLNPVVDDPVGEW